MQSPKEIFMEMLKPDGQPDRQLKQYEALSMLLGDPVGAYMFTGRKPGATVIDRWGVTISWPEGEPGSMPIVNDETRVIKDITRWRNYVHAPDIASAKDGYEEAEKRGRAMAGSDKLLACFMGGGLFELCHFMMGFENTLTNLYEHPTEMHELIDYLTDWKILYAKMLMDGIHPDMIFSHDDWGTKDTLFMQPEIWREFFKEPYRRFYGSIRERGVIVTHHADSYLSPIVEDMVEIGIQCWQGVLPENNIPELQERLKGRMILMGGVGAAIDRPDSEESEIRAYMKEMLDVNCPGGHFIPCITYGLPGTIYKHVDPIIDDEIDLYNQSVHIPGPKNIIPDRRVRSQVKTEQGPNKEAEFIQKDTTLEKITLATYRGQTAKTVKLCQEAIAEGISAQRILDDGLMLGMSRLGEAFTRNKVFVPEMLMAAKAMNAATEILKPLLINSESSGKGRVVIGTVKGDMHDIGKNLVKIMMEGAGLEVFDLGVDVPAEKFVQIAIDKKCDIICCSSLLTTCMSEMKNIVKQVINSNIHDHVKIMIGGAPITQSFCDEIGADAYTSDAAEAAKTAVQLVASIKNIT